MLPVRFLGLLALAVLLAGCGAREVFVTPNAPITGATLQPIYLATNRVLTQDLSGTTQRGTALSFARYDVTIPPGHSAGEIEFSATNPDPATSFTIANARRIDSRDAFGRMVRQDAGRANKSTDATLIYVHGFNTGMETAVYRHAQIAHDYGFKGPQVTFSWPSIQRSAGYVRDKDSVLIARDRLAELIIELTRDQQNVFIFGHSMGTQLVAETLRQLSLTGRTDVMDRIAGVVLVSPDIDLDLFESQYAMIDPLPQPFVLMVSNRDYALRFSSLLTAQPERLGSARDFERLKKMDMLVLDLSNLPNSRDHFLAANSPMVISLIRASRSGARKLEPGIIDVASQATALVQAQPAAAPQ